MDILDKGMKVITKYFAFWVMLISVAAYYSPGTFSPYAPLINNSLILFMFGVGINVTLDDFKLVFKRPKDVVFGIAIRYIVMPLVAFALAKILNLPPYLAAGLILVGCCPSGIASNVLTFLGRGDTALSLTVSSFNTVLSPIFTPAMFLLLAGSFIPIDANKMILDILKIVIFPLSTCLILRAIIPSVVERVARFGPPVCIFCIIFIIAVSVALNADKLLTVGLLVFLAVMLHNLIGLGLGYRISRMFGMPEPKARAISFEVGMENSGLGLALAIAHIHPLAALPAAIFSVWHQISGSFLATYWRNKTEKAEAEAEAEKANITG